MSRIRSIHPGLWTDEAFVGLSPCARLLFIGIWNECDDKGLFVWSPLKLKMRIMPADNIDAAALLAEIEETGQIRKYEIDGKVYGAVRNFGKFQRPKKPNTVHPSTSEILAFAGHGGEITQLNRSKVPHQFPTSGEKPSQRKEEGGRREDIEPNGSVVSASETPLTADELADEWNELAGDLGLPKVAKLTDSRKRRANARLRQYPEIEIWQRAFATIRGSPFLRGDNPRGWRADFDFLLQDKSFTKLVEGSYGQA